MTHLTNFAHEADTHQRILRAALEEFTQRGFKGASTRAIAERACVNEVTLFRHFGSKLEMLTEAVESAVLQMKVPEAIEEYLKLSFHEGFRQLISDYLMQLTSRSDILMLGMTESFSHPQVIAPLLEFFGQMRSMLNYYFLQLHAQGRMQQADFPVLTQTVISTLHSTPVMRKRATQEVTKDLTDDRVLDVLIDLVTRAYSLENAQTDNA